VGDAEVPQAEVGLTGRHVVVRVVLGLRGEVGRADHLAQEADADALLGVEQRAHRLLTVRGRQLVEHGGRGVGDRGAEAVHGLVRRPRVDRDRRLPARALGERDRSPLVQQLGAVGRGHPDAGLLGWRPVRLRGGGAGQ
jgi:hypothetical protein